MKTLTFALLAALAVSSVTAVGAAERAKPGQPTAPVFKMQKKALPDLVIANTLKVGPDEFKVYVKNQGNVNAPPSRMEISNTTSGGTGNLQIPALVANGGEWVLAKIWPNVKDGDRFKLYADYDKKVPETNENNNKYAFNW